MPYSKTAAITTAKPLPAPPKTRLRFDIPDNTHLLITTPARILSWDTIGIRTVFTSSKSGIAAATEAKDGSGVLAVADKHTVVLQDAKRGQEKSWGLDGGDDDDTIRHLQYSQDGAALFLTTKATDAVQCYSNLRGRLVSPPQALNSPPAALAVSPDGKLMVSASSNPNIVYIKNLALGSDALLVLPRASDTEVVVAAFHPERAHIFLLGFQDGTLAAYDSSRLSRSAMDGPYVSQESVGRAEIGRIAGVHRVTAAKFGGRHMTITGAAFLPGHRTRALSVGTDGRCRLVDFANGGIALTTWHAKASLTSLSVLITTRPTTQQALRPSQRPLGETDGTTNVVGELVEEMLIAVGREDGIVLVYSPLGLLLACQKISDGSFDYGRIISVEWNQGPSPRAIRPTAQTLGEALPANTTLRQQTTGSNIGHKYQDLSAKGIHDGPVETTPIRKFAIHPDEEIDDAGTVRHTPSPKRANQSPVKPDAHVDLFSPGEFTPATGRLAFPQGPSSPLRSRPRISSQTFLRTAGNLNPLPMSPTSDAGSVPSASVYSRSQGSVIVGNNQASLRLRRGSTQTRRPGPNTMSSLFEVGGDEHANNSREDSVSMTNARPLRDLRETMAASAHPDARNKVPVVPGKQSRKHARDPIRVQLIGRDGVWPTDSVQNPSWDDGRDPDIWITSDSEPSLSRHDFLSRSLARQTSRSRVNSKGTTSTLQVTAPASREYGQFGNMVEQPRQITPKDKFVTARSIILPDGAFSPASDDVRQLFPRRSSLSPQRRQSPKRRQSPTRRQSTLVPTGMIGASHQQPRTPWDKAREARDQNQRAQVVNNYPQPPMPAVQQPNSPDACTRRRGHKACAKCTAMDARVRYLEDDVARMKAEILALKAVARQESLPIPRFAKSRKEHNLR